MRVFTDQKGFAGIIALILLGLFVWGCVAIWNWGFDKFGPKTYTAFFYHDTSDYDNYISHEVKSIEDCRSWVAYQSARDFDGLYDYECGVNCRHEVGFSTMICKETIQ
jgi:hypothetical protein